jgi:hypothetical protein
MASKQAPDGRVSSSIFALDFHPVARIAVLMNTQLQTANLKSATDFSVRKGKRGETRIKTLFLKAGWRAWPQPSSGAHGTRTNTTSKRGDLVALCGDTRLRIEVKHYKNEPRTLQTLRGGCDVLAYMCSSTGRMAVFIDEGLFRDLLAWSAQALSEDGHEIR